MNPANYFVKSIPVFIDNCDVLKTILLQLQHCNNGNIYQYFASCLSVDTILDLTIENKCDYFTVDNKHRNLCWTFEFQDDIKMQILIDLFTKEIQNALNRISFVQSTYCRSLKIINEKLIRLRREFFSITSAQLSVEYGSSILIDLICQFLKIMDAYNEIIFEYKKNQNSKCDQVLKVDDVFIPYYFREAYARDAYFSKLLNKLRNKGINSGSEFEQFVTKHGFEIDCCISAYTLPNPDIANGFYSVNLLKDNKDADTVLIYIYKVSGTRNYTYVCFPYKSFSLTMSAQIADDFKNTICGFVDDLDEFKKQLYMCFPVFKKFLDTYCE